MGNTTSIKLRHCIDNINDFTKNGGSLQIELSDAKGNYLWSEYIRDKTLNTNDLHRIFSIIDKNILENKKNDVFN